TGELVYQPAEQATPLHLTVEMGAAVSATTVNAEAAESVPAPFRLMTFWFPLGAAAVASKLYAPPVFVQPAPRVGNDVEAIVVSASLELPVTVKPPAAPWRKKTVVPVTEAFVNEPNERLGVVGAVVSTFAVAVTAVETLPTSSLIVNV